MSKLYGWLRSCFVNEETLLKKQNELFDQPNTLHWPVPYVSELKYFKRLQEIILISYFTQFKSHKEN